MTITNLQDKLMEYSRSDYYGFHMPGHKRNTALLGTQLPYATDITEIEGFDDLHHADGILKDAQQRAAKLYGASETRFLVNGSTVGILSAILGSTNKGDRILVARHCHKSIYHAIEMNELRPIYLYPDFSEDLHLNTEISVSAVKTALMECSDIKAVMIVSPTYDGVISDIAQIAALAHERGIPLIVDEAHGAHLGFDPYFEENALAKGADIVIHSVHKTLPSLTQTALLHIQGELANREKIFHYLDMLQSSSPSYVLMASIDRCMRLLETKREELFIPYVRRLDTAREHLQRLRHLRILQTEHYDRSKFVISTAKSGMTGKELYQLLLDRYHLQMEMAAGTYVIAMTSVADTEEGFERLEKALFEIDARMEEKFLLPAEDKYNEQRRNHSGEQGIGSLPHGTMRLSIAEAMREKDTRSRKGIRRSVDWHRAIGYISLEYAYLYPPGSPLIVPGEEIEEEAIRLMERYRAMGFSLEGLQEEGKILVLSEDEKK